MGGCDRLGEDHTFVGNQNAGEPPEVPSKGVQMVPIFWLFLVLCAEIVAFAELKKSDQPVEKMSQGKKAPA